MKTKNNEGFTLIELIVVMAIIAILVLLAAPSFLNYTKDAKVTAMKQDTKILEDSAEIYHIDKGEWPVDINSDPIKFISKGGGGSSINNPTRLAANDLILNKYSID